MWHLTGLVSNVIHLGSMSANTRWHTEWHTKKATKIKPNLVNRLGLVCGGETGIRTPGWHCCHN